MKVSQLAGKTIKSARFMKKPDWDDVGYLALEFTDHTQCVLVAGYGCWTDESQGEYPTLITLSEKVDGLVPFDPDTETARGQEGKRKRDESLNWNVKKDE